MAGSLSRPEREDLLKAGGRLLSEGQYFEAHERFEDLWNSTADPSERSLWQGMAQVSAALVKHVRREKATALSLMAKARGHLAASPIPQGGTAALRRWLDDLAKSITSGRDLPSAPLGPELMDALTEILRSGP